jgi:hypothetical protein
MSRDTTTTRDVGSRTIAGQGVIRMLTGPERAAATIG